jgi:hypothetical protein
LITGWLLIGWVIWPVQYVGDAYTYELNDEAKSDYLAAVVDSYNLTGQIDTARQRLNTWTVEEKVAGLAGLFAGYQAEGRLQEAARVADLARQLQQAEGWDPGAVRQEAGQLAEQYADDGQTERAQAAALFANELGASVTPPAAGAGAEGPESQAPLLADVGLLLRVCGVLLLLLVLVLAVLILRRRRPRRPAAVPVAEEPGWVGTGPAPLLQRTSKYSLGMDNFDESFAVETADDEWLGECGMGITESLGNDTPRRVAAFEVWLFDKLNTRTITKVLMSDYANSNETLRNKLASRGEPVLATPGETFTLETPDLTVNAKVLEMEYGEGTPAFGYFENLKVLLTVYRNSESTAGEDEVSFPEP